MEERKRILELVKSGEISIDEAERLLTELEKKAQTSEENQEETEHKFEETISEVIEEENNESVSQDEHLHGQKAKSESKQEENTDHTEQRQEKYTHSEKYDSDSDYSKSSSSKDKLLNLFDTIVSKLRDFDLDFHHNVQVKHTFQQNNRDFNEINIEVPNGNIDLVTWDHSDVRVECDAKVYREDDLTKGKEKLLRDVDFYIVDGKLIFISKEKFMTVHTKIYVPSQKYRKVKVKSFHGSINIEDLQAEEMEMKTTNGKITLARTKAKEVELETVNGEIFVTESVISNFDGETINGKVQIDGEYKFVEVDTVSGPVYATLNGHEVERVEIESTTSSVYIHVPENIGIKGQLKSNFGSISNELGNIVFKEEKSEVINKQMKFETKGESDRKVYLTAESKTGSVYVKPIL